MIWTTTVAITEGSIEDPGHQFGYPIGIPTWVLQKNNFIKVVDKADKSDFYLFIYLFKSLFTVGIDVSQS